MRLLRRYWKRGAFGVSGFLVGLVLGAASVAGGSGTETRTVAAGTKLQTVTERGEPVRVTLTVTKTRTLQPKPPPPPRVIRHTGNGGKTLAPITVRRDSTLYWTAEGGLFQIFEDTLGVPVNSQASSGSTFIPAGRYTFQVNAIGDWTIEIR